MTARRPPAEMRANPTPEAIDRFWSRIEKSSTCWLWTGGLNDCGYGYVTLGGVQVGVHRLAYLLVRGPIPEGLTLDHLCRVRNCVNPDHLEPVKNGENVLRGISPFAINGRRTHCAHNHEFTPENTGTSKRGYRVCRECKRRDDRLRQRAIRAQGGAA